MNIITVTPIIKGALKKDLTYFTSKKIGIGSLVTVEIRKKETLALVTSIDKVSNLKNEIRKASFSIKKIVKIQTNNIFNQSLINTAIFLSNYFATTPGHILQSVTSKTILENITKLNKPKPPATTQNKKIINPHYVFQANDPDRMSTYKSFIREVFARNQSIFFCLPTIQNIEQLQKNLEKGIESYTYILHNSLPKKEILDSWNNIIKNDKPVLIIATGSFLSIPRHDIGAIILDNENSKYYKTQTMPFLDYRTFAEQYSKEASIKLICGDILLRSETFERYTNNELLEFAPIKTRIFSTAKAEIIDMSIYGKEQKYEPISSQVKELIKKNQKENENMFLLVTRKGLNPITICSDCGTIVMCKECSSPITLHKKNSEKNIFACHKCGHKRTASELCKKCNSWRLTPLGVGTELIESMLRKNHKNIIKFDSNSIKTHKKALEVINKFYNTPGAILIGTKMAVPYLNRNIQNIAVISIDGLFTLPSFRITEQIFRELAQLYTTTSKHFLIQTRNVKNEILQFLLKRNLLEFHRNEIIQRKELSYPPFKTFIKITTEGGKVKVKKDIDKILKILGDYEIISFPAFTQVIRNKYIMHILIKLDTKSWPDKKLVTILKGLPPYVKVEIDPEDLL